MLLKMKLAEHVVQQHELLLLEIYSKAHQIHHSVVVFHDLDVELAELVLVVVAVVAVAVLEQLQRVYGCGRWCTSCTGVVGVDS